MTESGFKLHSLTLEHSLPAPIVCLPTCFNHGRSSPVSHLQEIGPSITLYLWESFTVSPVQGLTLPFILAKSLSSTYLKDIWEYIILHKGLRENKMREIRFKKKKKSTKKILKTLPASTFSGKTGKTVYFLCWIKPWRVRLNNVTWQSPLSVSSREVHSDIQTEIQR